MDNYDLSTGPALDKKRTPADLERSRRVGLSREVCEECESVRGINGVTTHAVACPVPDNSYRRETTGPMRNGVTSADTGWRGVLVAALAGIALFLGVSVMAPPTADAGALIHKAHWRYQNWMDTSNMPAPPGRITFTLAGCPGWEEVSCAIDNPRHIPDEVWITPVHFGDRGVFLHEIGHIFDFQVMTAEDRTAFLAVAGLPKDRYWRAAELSPRPTAPPSELFASAYAACATGHRMLGMYGWQPTHEVHAASCQIIENAAHRRWTRLNPATVWRTA